MGVEDKAVQSYAKGLSGKKQGDRRGEHDGDWCRKTCTVTGKNGENATKTVKWFGFRLHLIADVTWEMPVAFEVTKASESEKTETKKRLETMKEERPEQLERCKYFLGDKDYDNTKIIK